MSTISQVPNAPASKVKVFYGNYQLVPAPFIEWTTEYEHDDANKTRTVTRTSLKLDGSFHIVPSGSYEQMMTMQNSLREAFGADAQEFRILAGPDNTTLAEDTPIVSSIFPMVNSVNIEADVQYNRVDYSIDLTVETNSVSGQLATDITDTWDLTENPEGLYIDVSHSVSAKGINTLSSGTNAIHNALAAVAPLLGVDKMPYYLPYYTEPTESGIQGNDGENTTSYAVSVQRQESADVRTGTYSVTENFIIASGTNAYVHNRTATYNEDENHTADVTLTGTVKGLGRTNLNADGGVGYTNAYNGFINDIQPLFAADASGVYLEYKQNMDEATMLTQTNFPDHYTSKSITKNKYAGTIQYSISYTDDPSENLPSGILEATSSLQRTDGIRLYASHPIPFRRLGAIIQDIKTTTEGQIVISASAKSKNTGNATTDVNRAIGYIQDEINRLRPSTVGFQTWRIDSKTQTHSDKELTAQATVTYVFTIDLGSVDDADSDITLTYM